MKNKNRKLLITTIILSSVFLLQGCSSATKYSKSWIKKNIDLTTDGKTILIEDDTVEMINADSTGMFFMEYSKVGEDWTFGYDIGGYQMFYYDVEGKQIGYIDYAEEQECITVDGDVSESSFVQDKDIVEDLFNIDFRHAKLTQYDDSDDGLAVVALSTDDKITVLFLDKTENVCRRLEVAKKNEDGNITEMFLAVPESVSGIEIPEAVFELERQSEMTGEEFSSLSSQFVVGALANASFNKTLQDDGTEESSATEE